MANIKLKDLITEATDRYNVEFDKRTKKYVVYGSKGSNKFVVSTFGDEDNAKAHATKLNKLLSGYAKIADKKKETALDTFHKVYTYAKNKNDWGLEDDMTKIINYVTKNNVSIDTLEKLVNWATGKDKKTPLDKIVKLK